MKIAVIAPTNLPARRANTLQVMKMTQALAAQGHGVRLAAPTTAPAHRARVSWDELARHYGLQHSFHVDWLPAHPALRRYDYALRAVSWARRMGADMIYTRLPQAAAYASQRGLPTIFEVHDLPAGRMGPLIFRRFLSGRGARRLVVITHVLLNDLLARFRFPGDAPFTVIAPDGVDLERYADLPEPEQARRELAPGLQAALPDDFIERFTAGYSGHLYPGRGIELLLELAKRLPRVEFLLMGGEPGDVQRVRERAASQGLANVVLTGFIPNAELPRYQAASEVLLMPYQPRVAASSGGDIARYLSPMKVFEYMACHRAILSSDLPVLREVLNPANSVLLPPQDASAWEQALETLQRKPDLRRRLADRARQNAAQYSWNTRAERILDGLTPQE